MDSNNTYSGPMSASSLNAPIKESEVNKALGKLHSVIEANQKIFADLDMRINPILRGEMPQETSDQGIKVGFQSPLANEIDLCVSKLDSLYRYILSVKNRVEL